MRFNLNMDEPSQSSFYEDDLPVGGITTGVKSHLKNEELFTFRSVCRQLKGETPEPIANELRANDAPDFTVPDCYDEKCQLEIQQDIDHTTSMPHSLPQEHRTVPSTEMSGERPSIVSNFKDQQVISAVCVTSTCVSPPGKSLHDSYEFSKDDTRKYGAQVESFLDWNAQSQSESELSSKASWPAFGVKSVVTDNEVSPDRPTLSFFTMAKQAHLLSDEQLQQIRESEHSNHSDQYPRLHLKRNSPSHETFGSPAEKFAKMDLDTEIENSSQDHELFSPEETINDYSHHSRVNTDQEVPFQEKGGPSKEQAIVDGKIPDNAISSVISFGDRPSLHNSCNWHGSTEELFHIEKAPFHEEPNIIGPCTGLSCLKFSKRNHDELSKKTPEKEGWLAYEENKALSKNAKHGGGGPCLDNQLGKNSDHSEEQQTVIIRKEELIHNEIHGVPNHSPVADNIPCKYPPLAQKTPYDTGMCSSLRAIDDRDLITESLDEVDCSSIKPTKEILEAEMPLLHEREVMQNWENCDCFLPKTSQDLESLSTSCPATYLNDMALWHAEYFDKVQISASSDNWINEQPAPSPDTTPNTAINSVCLASASTVNDINSTIGDTVEVKKCHHEVLFKETPPKNVRSLNQEKKEMPTNFPGQENDNKMTIAPPENKVFSMTTQEHTGSSMESDDENKENRRLFSYGHQENNTPGKSSGINKKKISESHQEETDHFRTEIKSKMIDLDGPELLQFAMIFVQGALKKSQTVPGCTEQLKCDEKNNSMSKTAPVFPWKRTILYHNQQAPSQATTYDETFSNETGSNVDDDGVNVYADNEEGPPHQVMPLPKTSCNRPLRLGLSRKHSNKPLHPYLKKNSNAKPD